MLQFVGILGIIVCVASVMLFGLDISHFLSEGRFVITDIASFMARNLPGAWGHVTTWANTMPQGDILVRVVSAITSIPMTLVGLAIGGVLIVIGFQMRKHY
jgi:hypothetical protein